MMRNFNLASKAKNSDFWVTFMCAIGFVVALLAPFDDVKAQDRLGIYDLRVRSATVSDCPAASAGTQVYLVRVVTIYMPPGARGAPSDSVGHRLMALDGSRAFRLATYPADTRVSMR